MLHPPSKTISIPLEVYTLYLHVILYHYTTFRNILSKIALFSIPLLSKSIYCLSHISLLRCRLNSYTIPCRWFSSFCEYPMHCNPITRWGRLHHSKSHLLLSLLGILLFFLSHIFIISYRILFMLPSLHSSISFYLIVLLAFLYHCSFYHNNVRIDLIT